jgi:hypothetical protein
MDPFPTDRSSEMVTLVIIAMGLCVFVFLEFILMPNGRLPNPDATAVYDTAQPLDIDPAIDKPSP